MTRIPVYGTQPLVPIGSFVIPGISGQNTTDAMIARPGFSLGSRFRVEAEVERSDLRDCY